MEKIETHEYDLIVIGAGGAGLRAAIEASAQGVSVGLVCKSLLGKAHTVMAEGGIAAALASVDPEDNWQTHFRDTMRGGKMLNQWEMAQVHAQESPDRVKELYKTAFNIPYEALIAAAARRQKWIDQSQSLNLFLAEPDMKTMSHMYRAAWR